MMYNNKKGRRGPNRRGAAEPHQPGGLVCAAHACSFAQKSTGTIRRVAQGGSVPNNQQGKKP